MRGRLNSVAQGNNLNKDAPPEYHDLTACIEYYACLQNCPMHRRNFSEGSNIDFSVGYKFGSPFSLLKLQLLRLDPINTEAGRNEALSHAEELGLNTCKECNGCKCGVGIDLMGKVVRPLLAAGEE